MTPPAISSSSPRTKNTIVGGTLLKKTEGKHGETLEIGGRPENNIVTDVQLQIIKRVGT